MKFSIADEFSRFPGTRLREHGSFTGQEFREDFLVPMMRRSSDVVYLISLDGTAGMGSSFLDEAFGGLISKEGFPKSEVLRRFKFESKNDPSYEILVLNSINLATPKKPAIYQG